MLQRILAVLVLLVTGDAIAQSLDVPVPGPALGLAVLILVLAVSGGPDTSLDALFDSVTPYFPLCFVPSAVGVIANLEALALAWVQIVTAIVLGTTITLVVTGWLVQALLRIFRDRSIVR